MMNLSVFPTSIVTSRALILRLVEIMNEEPDRVFNLSLIHISSKVNGVIAIDAEGSVDVKSCTFSDYTDVEDEYESALALSLIHI